MAPIIESSDYEYSREEEERQFLRSLESPKLEMASMHPGRSSLGHVGKGSKDGAKGKKAEVPSIGDEALPVPSAFGSKHSLSRSSLPTFDTPMSSARQSADLDLSDLGPDDYDSALDTPASTMHLRNLQPSHLEEGSSAWTSRSRNLIELDESGSSIAGSSPMPTADIRGMLHQSKSHFERSISNLKEQVSPASKVLAKEAPELRDLVQPRKLYAEHESSPIISSHLSFPEKKASPHAGTFKAPLRSRAGRDIDEAISNVQGQLRVMEAEMLQKKLELERLFTEKEASKSKWSFVKRFLFALLFVGLFLLFDLVLRVVVTQQQFDLGSHIDLDQITAFYKNYLDLAVATVQDLRAKGTIPF